MRKRRRRRKKKIKEETTGTGRRLSPGATKLES
jgi:hypothetical protein